MTAPRWWRSVRYGFPVYRRGSMSEAPFLCPASFASNSSCILDALRHYVGRGVGKYEKTPLYVGAKDAKARADRAHTQPGLWLEFGAWSGQSTRHLAELAMNRPKIVYSFDSFQGLPEDWRKADRHLHHAQNITDQYLSAGSFSLNGQPPYEIGRASCRERV